jgi:putative transposase
VRLTYKFRLKDKHAAELNRQARAVNYVWNYCNETQERAARDGRKWLSGVDLQQLTAGSGPMLDISADTIGQICRRYDFSRRSKRKRWLRFRGRKSLGWIPFKDETVRFDGRAFTFRGALYTPMHTRDCFPAGAKIGCGTFSADSKGRWYINATIATQTANVAPIARVGIDLGLKDIATLSDGHKVAAPKLYRASEVALGTAQRANKGKRARAIHTKVANRRRDFIHKLSNQLTKQYGLIVVGDVSPSKLARTRMAKSVLDAGWSDLKAKLSYKSIRNGGSCLEVSERLTTQTCSQCGSLPLGRPRGIAGLSKRVWECGDCGAVHDRDVNAAQNILRLGLETLSEGARVMKSLEQSTENGDDPS